MDAKEDILKGHIQKALAKKSIFEVFTNKYREQVPPTFDEGKNTINGIFLSMILQMVWGSYIHFNEHVLFEHQGIRLDVSYSDTFG